MAWTSSYAIVLLLVCVDSSVVRRTNLQLPKIRFGRGVLRRSLRTKALDSTPSEASGCPVSRAKSAISEVLRRNDENESTSPRTTEVIPIPGPKGLPADLISNSIHVMKIPIYGIEEATLRWGQAFGPIVRFDNSNLGIKSWVFVNEPNLIEHVCFKNAMNYKERYLPDIYRFATQGKGILGSTGEFNLKHRKMCKAPFTSKRYLKLFADTTSRMAKELTTVWRESSDSGVVTADIADHVQRLTLDVIGDVAFTYDFGGMKYVERSLQGDSTKGNSDKLMEYVNKWTGHVGKLAAPWITEGVLEAGTKMGDPRLTDLKSVIESMRGILFKIIEERREMVRNNDPDVPEDLMTSLIRIQAEEGLDSFSDVELWEDIHDVMGAGHETTANTLATALWEVSMHPEVGAKVREELETVLGKGPNSRLPSYEDWEAGSLKYTTQVVKETLRMYPSIPLFVREVGEDDVLPGGYQMQGGDVVFMSAYALGRTERFWPEPFKFDPERFANDEDVAPYTWLPFGAGPRMCLGSNFAMMSTVLQLATILHDYSFEPVTPNYRSSEQSNIPRLGAWRGGMPFEYDMTISFPEGCTLRATPN
uniref:Cytochrome P450 n=4 Tax=Lotharella globosa TaxID=91324 RepID=A0A7S4DFN2_9EUKA|mmetsp:Transcript_869/g.1681  ORF Transcript_869/g.1681 Transcript_869/m.1681 type:complete len:591 (-) Transcript_869:8-1780(-)|eukprot:CAMPEP_0167786374 /NCGR_PEP_ID=MMETSP0111_2-20121227/8755_1 /TAXON_ID=91324 /ORGANISM="Lotharella globosa, Strain CCCM811" /LENGTH=590 /DNA_ID=CAMNT_0007677745 /DNA_START=170 /DNA_END=1942 /DNA_ORIENTATION=-